MLQFLTRIFGSRNERIVRGFGRIVRAAGELEPALQTLSDEALGAKTAEFRERLNAGTSLDELMRWLLPAGFFLVTPGTRSVTVGGAIASDIHGKFRLGCFSDAVSTIDLVAPATGPVAVGSDDDAFWATSGGMGLTGIITGATLEFQPVETAYMVSDTERVPDVDECMRRMLEGDDLGGTTGGQRHRGAFRVRAAGHHHGHATAQATRRAHRLERGRAHTPVLPFGDDEDLHHDRLPLSRSAQTRAPAASAAVPPSVSRTPERVSSRANCFSSAFTRSSSVGVRITRPATISGVPSWSMSEIAMPVA